MNNYLLRTTVAIPIDDITMTECCMIMMGFGQVWEYDMF